MSQTKQERRSYLNVLDAVFSGQMAPGSDLVIWGFDKKPGKLYSGEPRKVADIYHLEDDIISYSSSSEGTTPACVLPDMIRAAKETKKPVVLLLFWDAEDDDVATTQTLVGELAKLPQVKALWILGMPP
ncbi:MAG: hypothetical protein C4320_09405, partial [Armatimonadota bacterium]